MDKKDRICIVGSGPAGLATALALRESGYNDITIYERANKVGGQVCSKQYSPKEGAPIIYEQCSIQPMGSFHLNKIIQHYGLSFLPPEEISYYSLIDDREVYRTKAKDRLHPYFYADLIKLFRQLWKYRTLWKPGFFDIEIDDQLAQPFREWILEQKFTLLEPPLLYGLNGFISFHKNNKNIPTIYGLKVLMQALHPPMRYINGKIVRIREGFEELWKRVAQDFNVQMNVRDLSIHRDDNKIHLMKGGKVEIFDRLFIACHHYSAFLDCTPLEQEIASKATSVISVRAAFIAKKCSIDGLKTFTDCIDGKTQKQCIGITAYQCFDTDLRLYTGSYVTPDDSTQEKELRTLTEDAISPFGGTVIEFVSIHKEINFGSYFSGEDLQQGILARSESRQGKRNTYFVGEMLSTGTNAIVVDYAYDLIDRISKKMI